MKKPKIKPQVFYVPYGANGFMPWAVGHTMRGAWLEMETLTTLTKDQLKAGGWRIVKVHISEVK
jgi:hypothetical protein